MTIRHMKIFLALCSNSCNTTKAAEQLHMTQPAVSLAVRELEEYYGVCLFDRIGRRLKITTAGQHFLEYASHILSLFDDMERSMKNWDSFGLLRIGSSITIGSQFMPYYVKAFQERCPGTKVQVIVAPLAQLEEKLLNNLLDFALAEGVSHVPSFVSEEYMEDSLTVICPPDGMFRHGQEISVDTFRQQNFLLRERGSGTRETFEHVTEEAGFFVTPSWEAVSTTALVNAVSSGLGISVLPSRMVAGPLKQGLVNAVTVKGLSFCRKFRILYHREKFLPSSARTFIELCRSLDIPPFP